MSQFPPGFRPVRPPEHPATCECDSCALYWSLSLKKELEVMRTAWERAQAVRKGTLQGNGMDRHNVEDFADSPFLAEGLDSEQARKVLLRHFQEQWYQAERDGFEIVPGISFETVWAYKERCFEAACRKARDELGRSAHLRTEKALMLEMNRTHMRIAQLLDIERTSKSELDQKLAHMEAARLQLELHPIIGGEVG